MLPSSSAELRHQLAVRAAYAMIWRSIAYLLLHRRHFVRLCTRALSQVRHHDICSLAGETLMALARPMPLAAPVMTATLPSSLPDMVLPRSFAGWQARSCDDQLPVAMNTFFSSVNASRASGPSSRPMPERLKPPKGVQ